MLPAYFSTPSLYAFTTLRMVNISLVHGNADRSSISFCCYAMFLAGILGRYEEALEFGRLSLKLIERFPNREMQYRVPYGFGVHIAPFRLPLSDSITYIESSLLYAAEAGDRAFQSWAALFCTILTYAMGQPLSVISGLIARFSETILLLREPVTMAMIDCLKQVLYALGGKTRALDSLDDGQFDTAQYLHMLQEQHLGAAECWYHVRRAQLAFYRDDFPTAYRMAAAAERLASASPGVYHITEIPFWKALALLAQPSDVRQGAEEELVRALKMLAAYADNAPCNYLHKLRIVQAELARTAGQSSQARATYLDAVALAEAGGFTQDAALAHSLYARFLRLDGDKQQAEAHRLEARRLYSAWGASELVTHLEAG